MNVASRLRARFPSVPDDIIAGAAEDVSKQLRLRGWRVSFDGSTLYVRRERAAGAMETFHRSMRRASWSYAAWVALLSIVRWWSEIVSFLGSMFGGASDASCGSSVNLTIEVCGINSAIISLLPIVLIVTVLGGVLSAVSGAMRGRGGNDE